MTYDLCLRTAATIQAGDLTAAEAFLSVIALTLKDAALSPHQRVYLYRLRKVWGRRAAGEDLRWNVLGSRPGAPKRQATTVVRTPLQTSDTPTERLNTPPDSSPLASILDKYGSS